MSLEMNRVLVASNCQTAGLTQGLRLLLSDAEVIPIPYPEFPTGSQKLKDLCASFSQSDYVISTAPTEWNNKILSKSVLSKERLITAPEIYFEAFHPDLVYAFDTQKQTLMSPAGPYNSAIVLWAWRNGRTVTEAVNLFDEVSLRGLGYLARWNNSVERLKTIFSEHQMDVWSFLLPLQHLPVFMHTINHPRKEALAQLVRLICKKIDGVQPDIDEPIEDFMNDGLLSASAVWPVYPAIAAEYGINGSLTWKTPEGTFLRLPKFVEESFAMYDKQHTNTFHCEQLTWPIYDEVLALP